MLRTVIFSLTIIVLCEHGRTDSDTGCEQTHTRVKRGKYYSSSPQRFYNRPPPSFPVKGAFSYTPPPFMTNDGPHYPGPRPYKVSKRPTNGGLGDEDLNNLMKHLTKQDLDKIIEFAYEKQKNYDNYEYSKPPIKGYKEADDTKVSYEDPSELKPYEAEFNKYINYVTDITPPRTYSSEDPRGYSKVNLDTGESVHKSHTYVKPSVIIPNQIHVENREPENPYYIESNEEERLPKPVNMRDDFEVSYTNNVPTVVKSDSSSYKVEDFGNLPLMNYYDSKLHSVSSYHVPHYTVTQGKSQPPSLPPSSSSSLLVPSPAAASIKAPPLEPAPPASAARDQSDAHLKATKIWSHKSKGTAYTLHNDGTLTLERPGRPNYG